MIVLETWNLKHETCEDYQKLKFQVSSFKK